MELIEQGNKLFQEKKYQEAINKYTESLSYSLDKKDEIRAYGNRSQSFINLKEYEKGLEDANQVLLLEENQLKGVLKKITCLNKLKKKKELFDFMSKVSLTDKIYLDFKKEIYEEYEVIEIETLIDYYGAIISKLIFSTKVLKEIEEKEYHDTWHVIDYFDGTKDKKFEIPCPPELFLSKTLLEKYPNLNYKELYMKFSLLGHKSIFNISFYLSLFKLLKKTLLFKKKIVTSFEMIYTEPKCKTVNWYDVPKGGRLVTDFESHFILLFNQEYYLDFHSALFSYFDTTESGHFIKIFHKNDSHHYRLKEKKDKEYFENSYCSEYKLDNRYLLKLQYILENFYSIKYFNKNKFI